jgi:hypothetical protein
MIALAAVMPAPNPTNKMLSPFFMRSDRKASTKASGMEADDVFPV